MPAPYLNLKPAQPPVSIRFTPLTGPEITKPDHPVNTRPFRSLAGRQPRASAGRRHNVGTTRAAMKRWPAGVAADSPRTFFTAIQDGDSVYLMR